VTVTVHSPNGETYYYATEGWALRALKNSGLIKENVISVSKHSLTRSINQVCIVWCMRVLKSRWFRILFYLN